MPSTRYFDIALKLTNCSSHPKHRMAAVIVKGGAILSKAANKGSWGAHAERRALKKAKNTYGATIYIARENKKMSKPCDSCMKKIRELGIYNIVYCDWNKQLVLEKVSDLIGTF